MVGSGQQDDRVRFISSGVEFFVVIGLLTGGGYWLDTWLGTLPLFTLVGLAAGFAGALWRLIRQVRPPGGGDKDESSESNRSEKRESEPDL
jgi:F0F1-type ATP synthase assembly protein I